MVSPPAFAINKGNVRRQLYVRGALTKRRRSSLGTCFSAEGKEKSLRVHGAVSSVVIGLWGDSMVPSAHPLKSSVGIGNAKSWVPFGTNRAKSFTQGLEKNSSSAMEMYSGTSVMVLVPQPQMGALPMSLSVSAGNRWTSENRFELYMQNKDIPAKYLSALDAAGSPPVAMNSRKPIA